jgi:hypothetical protein
MPYLRTYYRICSVLRLETNHAPKNETTLTKYGNRTEHCPLNANSRSAPQNIPHLLQNLKVRYRDHKSSPLDPVPIQMNPDQSPSMCFNSRLRYNSPIYLRLPGGLLPSAFPTKFLYAYIISLKTFEKQVLTPYFPQMLPRVCRDL